MDEEIGNFTRVVKTVKQKIHLKFKNTISEQCWGKQQIGQWRIKISNLEKRSIESC